jgi:hypothetical protein
MSEEIRCLGRFGSTSGEWIGVSTQGFGETMKSVRELHIQVRREALDSWV